ncbi:hypothetical protein EUX98_g5199 [Antrodiella citrinella]|uniref:Protein kinase domain-containing protein n=1 Tax=Antrodiella citrinella TaxID=2447956 RepID=A0A4S4MTZ9_9APHY|nr:hypothetical protein EUX98_g5199 [Antrodiella citrinella]
MPKPTPQNSLDADADEDAVLEAMTEPIEATWRAKQKFLESKGYMLRPRYHQGWKPSWEGTGKEKAQCEDSIPLPLRKNLIDATRTSDNKLVYIKRVEPDDVETRIALMLSSDDARRDPRNHAVPVLDHFENDADSAYLVMPLLRALDDPPFLRVGDMLEFCDQVLEGLVFQHEKGVAHRDCSYRNIMMDATSLYPDGYHPVNTTTLPDGVTPVIPLPRSTHPVTYYYIDFGISVVVPAYARGERRLVEGDDGQDRAAPELHTEEAYDPFALDVFLVGDLLKRNFLDVFSDVEFLRPLVSEMMREDPSSRPGAREVLSRWKQVRKDVDGVKELRSRPKES